MRQIGPPTTQHFRLDETSSVPATWHNEPAFSIVRLESCTGLQDRIVKLSEIPALLVSVPLKPLELEHYRVWAADDLVSTPFVRAFSANVIDLDTQPSCWAGSAFDYVHYHMPRETLDDVGCDFGYASLGPFRPAIMQEDLVLAQLTRSVLPFIGRADSVTTLALEQFQLVLAAHLLQRYGQSKIIRSAAPGGLTNWQKQRATELLRAHLDGSLRLAELAKQCGLSVSHFSRAFKASFGVSSHRWLVQLRIEVAKDLLVRTREPLVEVAIRSGFSDQAAFTRIFHKIVGVSPGRWRREHAPY